MHLSISYSHPLQQRQLFLPPNWANLTGLSNWRYIGRINMPAPSVFRLQHTPSRQQRDYPQVEEARFSYAVLFPIYQKWIRWRNRGEHVLQYTSSVEQETTIHRLSKVFKYRACNIDVCRPCMSTSWACNRRGTDDDHSIRRKAYGWPDFVECLELWKSIYEIRRNRENVEHPRWWTNY